MHAKMILKMQPQVKMQQIISSSLLQISGAELEQIIAQEMAANPALERIRVRRAPHTAAMHQAQQQSEQIEAMPSALDRLAGQLSLLVGGDDLTKALHLLYSLDGHGYLRIGTTELAAELGVEPPAVERLIRLLHELEPPGVGARDLRECLLLQVNHLEATGADCALVRRILEEAWDDFANQHWQQTARKLKVLPPMIAEARRFIIKNLYPYPLSLLEAGAGRTALLSQPDLIIRCDRRAGGQIYQVEVPGCEEYQLRVNNSFAATLNAHNGGRDLSADDAAWLQVHLSEARLFIASLQQRWATLRRIGEYLTRYQADFLAHGPRHLQPLTRAAISAALGLHESTVSRAIRDKVVQMPDGHLLLLADFFDGSLAVKAALRELLTADGQTMSDRELAQALERQGLLLARRTVAKYREQLSIPISHRRRQVDASYLAL